jgi:hypothetical protein
VNGPAVPLCASCGVVAPAGRASCEACGSALPTPRAFAPASGDIAWTALRASFTCRACGFPSPLEGVELDEGVECAQCGSYQRFEAHVWGAGLAFAHAVGDLGGPDPEGRFPSADVWIGDANPHAKVGVTETFATHDEGGFTLEACPGHPVCARCKVPLEIRAEPGGVAARCGRCGEVAHYALPPRVSEQSPAACAVVAEEQRRDRPQVRMVQGAAGIEALACPNCGAGLRPPSERTVECTYCRTVAFVPPRARARGQRKLVHAAPFWIAFRGPSSKRVELERPALPDAKSKLKGGSFFRGVVPIPGIELAPVRPGIDFRQLALTTILASCALGAGYVVWVLAQL